MHFSTTPCCFLYKPGLKLVVCRNRFDDIQYYLYWGCIYLDSDTTFIVLSLYTTTKKIFKKNYSAPWIQTDALKLIGMHFTDGQWPKAYCKSNPGNKVKYSAMAQSITWPESSSVSQNQYLVMSTISRLQAVADYKGLATIKNVILIPVTCCCTIFSSHWSWGSVNEMAVIPTKSIQCFKYLNENWPVYNLSTLIVPFQNCGVIHANCVTVPP